MVRRVSFFGFIYHYVPDGKTFCDWAKVTTDGHLCKTCKGCRSHPELAWNKIEKKIKKECQIKSMYFMDTYGGYCVGVKWEDRPLIPFLIDTCTKNGVSIRLQNRLDVMYRAYSNIPFSVENSENCSLNK